jgi:nucleoside-diphosphate-sugar epimerase
MKILITGGSGFLGINLIRYLIKKGFTDITSLDIAEFDYVEKNEISAHLCDIRNKDLLPQFLKDQDVVIHSAAALPLYKVEDIYSTDVQGTTNLLEVAYDSGVKRFIFISTTAVYDISASCPVYEDNPFNAFEHYGKAKVIAEQVCEKFRKKMCVPIIRPKTFIGPERLGVFSFFYDWVKDGKNFPIIGKGNNRFQLLDVEDLCELIYLCVTVDEKAAHDTFNAGAKEFTTMREDLQFVLDKAGKGKKIIPFPAAPVIFILKILEFLHLSPIYQWIYETSYRDSFVSIEKAERKIGFTPKYSNKDALMRNYEWYLKNIQNFRDKTGISHRTLWKQKALGWVKMFF